MKFIKIKNLTNPIYIFDDTDILCETCSYPLDEKKKCVSCAIFHSKKYMPYSGGKLFFDKVISVGRYVQLRKSERLSEPEKQSKDIMSWLVYNYKKDSKYIPFCVNLLKMKIKNFLSELRISSASIIICPVPEHETEKYKKTDLLAQGISKELELQEYPLLKKLKQTKKQHDTKNFKEKYENVGGIFEINESYLNAINGKTIFLVDDVVSSMATINECSKILKEAGVKKVYVFSLGRNILPD